jgi:hypothetical protein
MILSLRQNALLAQPRQYALALQVRAQRPVRLAIS